MALRDARLTGQRDVLCVLVDGDLDAHIEAVASALHRARRARHATHAAALLAAIGLLADALDGVAHLDDVDQLGCADQAIDGVERVTAVRANLLIFGQVERDLLDRQLWLLSAGFVLARLGRLLRLLCGLRFSRLGLRLLRLDERQPG